MYNKGDLVIVNYMYASCNEDWVDDYRAKLGVICDTSSTGVIIDKFNKKDGSPILFEFDEVSPVDKIIHVYIAPQNSSIVVQCDGKEYAINDTCTMDEIIRLYDAYPNFRDRCYKIIRNREGFGYAVTNITWEDSQVQRKEFNDGIIFKNKTDAQEVVNEFNEILKKRRG